MTFSLVLLSLLLLDSGKDSRGGAEPVFRGIADDGTVLFGDRPSLVAPPGHRRAARLSLPPGNIIAPTPVPVTAAPSDPAPSVAAPAGTANAATGDADQQACQRMRIRLAALWQERRQGYPASRGQELKRSIRQLQSDMKAHCGHWR